MVVDPGQTAIFYVAAMYIMATVVALLADKMMVRKDLKLIHIAILFWSGTVYLGFVLNVGFVEQFGWYLDWAITTPLMVLAVLLSAGASTRKIALAMTAQALVIILGAFGDVSGDPLFWFGLSLIPFFGVLLILSETDWKTPEQGQWLFGWIFLFWITYPVIWLLQPEVLDILPTRTISLLFLVVPAISKVGLAVIDILGQEDWDDSQMTIRDTQE